MRRTALVLAIALAGCGSERSPRVRPLPAPDPHGPLLTEGPLSERVVHYRIEATLDTGARRIQARQTLRWVNAGDQPVTELPLHLYMNAFKNDDSVFMKESRGQHRSARASDGGWGWIEVPAIRLGDIDLRPQARFDGPDETVLTVPLPAPVEPGAAVELDLDFVVQLPEVFARTGYKGEFVMVGQWFPKVARRVEGRWQARPFHLNSEFFSDFGVYEVDLTVPDTHQIAATGVLTAAVDHDDATRTLSYRAEDVHDFAWMADPYMEYLSGTATVAYGPVEVRVYYRPEQRHFAERHLEAGIGAVEQYSRLYVPYPWARMSIITPPLDAASGAGGMEYPTLVTTAGDWFFARPGIRLPEYVTIHEVGHNWFQGMLASNEVAEAWMDEGVNDYSNGVVLAALYGEGESMVDWLGYQVDFYQMQRAASGPMAAVPDPIATPSYAFADNEAYGTASYTKTSLALRTLENIVGVERFRAAMKTYAQRYAFRHPGAEDLFATLEQELGRELDWFIDPAFYRRGGVDLQVRDLDCRRPHPPRGVFGHGDEREEVTRDQAPTSGAWVCEIMLVNAGTVPVPVDVELHFEDGTTITERWSELSFWHTIRTERSSPVIEVIIDPHQRIVLNDNLLDSAIRADADPAAARRAGARTTHWIQTLMQLTGL
jgi:hypothetical protein